MTCMYVHMYMQETHTQRDRQADDCMFTLDAYENPGLAHQWMPTLGGSPANAGAAGARLAEGF